MANACRPIATSLLLSIVLATACRSPQAESGLLAPRDPTPGEIAFYALSHGGPAPAAAALKDSPAWQAQARLDDWGGQSTLLDEAKAWLDKALTDDPNDPQALMQLARYAVMSGDAGGNDGALQILNRVIQAHPGLTEAYVLQGHVMTNVGLIDGAHAALDKAAALGSTSPWLGLNRATLLLDAGRFAEAAELCNAAIYRHVPSSKAMITAYQCRQTRDSGHPSFPAQISTSHNPPFRPIKNAPIHGAFFLGANTIRPPPGPALLLGIRLAANAALSRFP